MGFHLFTELVLKGLGSMFKGVKRFVKSKLNFGSNFELKFSNLEDLGVHITTGKIGEDEALKYLEERGLELVERNWRTKIGEIDLILKEKSGEIVFVEVKTRKISSFSSRSMASSVSKAKKKRLRILAEIYLKKNFINIFKIQYRIDFVGVFLNRENNVIGVRHYKAAI